MDKKAIEAKIMEIKQWERELKSIQETIDSLKDDIKAEMLAEDKDTFETDTFIVRYKLVSTNRFDSKALKKDNEKLYNLYLKESLSRRFTID